MLWTAGLCLLAATSVAQKVGTNHAEQHPQMPLWTCTASGCSEETKSIVLDSNWRWIHNGQSTNCYTDGDWDEKLCPDPETCTQNCHLDGADTNKYSDTYGIHVDGKGATLGFVTTHQYGNNFGSRVYMMDNEHEYKVFKLKNREFTMTVDVASLPCGLNGAAYFVEMEADGGKASSGGTNEAGATYGTGYCDAQCPRDMKFIDGQANTLDWNATSTPPIGKYGSCCAEMDIWEANSRSSAYTPHPCSITGAYRCDGVSCGDNGKDQRYDGVCDKDGCDFNSWRMGNQKFYGREGDFEVDTTLPVTVVTQFITSDDTDAGDLVNIRRFYVQDGKKVANSESSMAGVPGNSLTDGFCDEMKTLFGDVNDFKRKGGLKAMGEALDRGMVLVMSLWDDYLSDMLWLDSQFPTDKDPSTNPGVDRGPCKTDTGSPKYVRAKYPTASVKFSDIKIGHIGTTLLAPSGSGSHGDEFGDDRRLGEALHV